MIFGPSPVEAAEGAVLAHSVKAGGRKIAKGRLLGPDEIAAMRAEGIAEIMVARLEPGDVGEDAAARSLAEALVPDPEAAGLNLTLPHAGRVNLNAAGPGIVELDAARIRALNLVDPGLTFATLAPYTRVTERLLVGTVKVIPYAVSGGALAEASRVAAAAIRIRPVVRKSAGLIMTGLAGEDDKLAGKGREAIAGRLDALGMDLSAVVLVPHEAGAIAAALAELPGEIALILTSAATSDLHDTAPEGVREAGGEVARFGLPVDPGNLLFHGRIGPRPVIGLPNCARSPALNGSDWVLERLACGLEINDEDIAAMGVGGLLKEIPMRPQPRERGKI